jgi:chemotaxis protein histidine kinase CheA
MLDELRVFFVDELRTILVAAEQALAALKKDPTDARAVQTLRQQFHRVAGTAGSVGLSMLGRLCASCEAMSDAVQDGNVSVRHALRAWTEGVAGMRETVEEHGASAEAAN